MGDPTIINAKVELEDLTQIELNDGCALRLNVNDKENVDCSTANSTPVDFNASEGKTPSPLMAQLNDLSEQVENKRNPLEVSSTAAACE
jgi:hypothetical protein